MSIVDFIVPIIAIPHCIATLYLIIEFLKNKVINPIIKIERHILIKIFPTIVDTFSLLCFFH